ncbi:MAG: GIY-YIG nuclease family protein [Candidatus Berkelbacteria bacterium]
MQDKTYYVYIVASFSNVLYIGMTNDLVRRVYEHKNNLVDGFTKKYRCHKLVYFELSNDVKVILEREKQLKRWSRSKKLALICEMNPELKDLSTSSR